MRTNIPSGTVTFLFTDIEGSTRLLETLRVQYESLLDDHHRIFRSALPHWNGHEMETQGDSFFIAFARAIDAVHFVIETQHKLAEHHWPEEIQVKVRMGLHTGEPLVSQDMPDSSIPVEDPTAQPRYIGMDVHRAARIAAVGHGGQVLLSQTTRDLIYQDLPEETSLRYLGAHTLKDIRHPQQIYQLLIAGLPSEFPELMSLGVQSAPPALDESLLAMPPAGDSMAELEMYRGLLRRWRAQGRQILDKASLAILLGAPRELTFPCNDLAWLLRSALHEEIELWPWIERAESLPEAIEALDLLLAEYPRPQQRLLIVKALCEIQEIEADEILLRVAVTDDSHEVCTRAALGAASHGRLVDVQRLLAAKAGQQDNPAALSALIAIIDEYGSLPPEISDYPRLQVAVSLIQRRWALYREAIIRRSGQTSIGGALALMILGSLLPLLARQIIPENFEENLQFISVAAWSVNGALGGLVWGGLQGLVTGAAVGLADILWAARPSSFVRFVIAGFGGWVFTVLMILFSSAGLFSPHAGPAVYIPVFIVYGFLQGGALAWVIPRLGVQRSARQQALRALGTSLFIGLVALPTIYLVYQEGALARLPIDWLYALLMPAGLALAVRARSTSSLPQAGS